MIAVLSPAKTFSQVPTAPLRPSQPYFAAEARKLAAAAAKLNPKRLQALMHISADLAALNAGRYAAFDAQEERPAIAAFDGDVYRGFDAPSADAATLAFTDDHVRLLSGLYGLLRPTDAIRPYRLEMGTPWAPRGKDLYGFWKASIAARIEEELEAEGSGTILNLASKEYWRALGPQLSKEVRVVTVDFRDAGPNGLRFNAFVAKKARGAMARHLCETRADAIEALEDFDYQGYRFVRGTNEPDVMHFVR